jgi:hypothetical protein
MHHDPALGQHTTKVGKVEGATAGAEYDTSHESIYHSPNRDASRQDELSPTRSVSLSMIAIEARR